jgi:outer membrane protein assembly factor BamB
MFAGLHAEEHWPRFRGPTGRGHSSATDVPLRWSAESVAWKTPLRGEGQSSPVNWGDKLFLTGASEDGRERYVFCVSRIDGTMLWERTIPCDAPETPHPMNGFASPTCATDGERVVAFFGPGGLHAFDLGGEKLWSRDLGAFPGPWGVGASPIIVDGKVIQNCDAEGESSLVALDMKTGETLWKTEREPKPRGGWSTPIVIAVAGKRELVLNGELGVRGYDLGDGEELWFCRGFNGRGAPVPDFADGRLHVVNGKPGDTYAVRPGGRGDVTESHRGWHTPRRVGRDLPSPAVVDGRLIVVSMSGTASCYDAKTGERLWEEKLGVKGQFAASPLVIDGHVLIQNVYGGGTVVIKPGPERDIVAINELGAEVSELFRATLAPIQGRMFARSLSMLYCIGW